MDFDDYPLRPVFNSRIWDGMSTIPGLIKFDMKIWEINCGGIPSAPVHYPESRQLEGGARV
jgi:hypothetical protein